jgi:hypothetical protein
MQQTPCPLRIPRNNSCGVSNCFALWGGPPLM